MELEQFATFGETFDAQTGFSIDNQLSFAYDADNRVLKSLCAVSLSQPDRIFLKIAMASYFELNPDSLEALRKGDKFVLPQEILVQFASLTYGALRGALHLKVCNTPFSGIVLPPIFLQEIIDQPLSIDMAASSPQD